MVRGCRRGGGSEKDGFWGVDVLESLPLPRVEIDIEGGRSARVLETPFSVSSRLNERSLVLAWLILPPRRSAAPSAAETSSTGSSLFGSGTSLTVVLISPMPLLIKAEIFSTSADVLTVPLPFAGLLDVADEGRFRTSGSIDCAEFCRVRDG